MVLAKQVVEEIETKILTPMGVELDDFEDEQLYIKLREIINNFEDSIRKEIATEVYSAVIAIDPSFERK
jgi:hypothetical protein